MMVFVTTNALIDGIERLKAIPTDKEGQVIIPRHGYHPTYFKPEWHNTFEEAKAQAEQMRKYQIEWAKGYIDRP